MAGGAGAAVIVGQHPSACPQIGAGVEYRLRRQAEVREVRAVDLHQPGIEIGAALQESPGRRDRIGGIAGLATQGPTRIDPMRNGSPSDSTRITATIVSGATEAQQACAATPPEPAPLAPLQALLP